jgi:hypothetical protein
MDQAIEAASYYGWTPENKKCFSINMVGVETPSYDGVSYWQCQACGAMVDRFTGVVTEKEEPQKEDAQSYLRQRCEDGRAWARAHPVVAAMIRGFFWCLVLMVLLSLLGVI